MRLVLLAAMCVLVGCENPKHPAPSTQSIVTPEYPRFQLVSGTAYGLALDTKTGELCHTYDAHMDAYVPTRGATEGITLGHPSLTSIPLCLDLSQNERATVENLPQYHHPGIQPKGSNP